MLARLFLNPNLASWGGEGDGFHWTGKWDGISSLYNQSSLGLPWLCLFMTIALWFAVPARRQIIVWMLAILIGAIATFSMVFTSFTSIKGLNEVIGYTDDVTTARYLIPLLLAWFAIMMNMLFGELPLPVSIPNTGAAIPFNQTPVVSKMVVQPARRRRKNKK